MSNQPMQPADFTVAWFAEQIEKARANGEAPIDRRVVRIVGCQKTTKKGTLVRIVGESLDGVVRPLSTWQPSEMAAVHDALARAFC